MYGIRNVIKKNACVIALVMFYQNRTTNPKKVFRVLIFVLYSVIDNYVCIDYLCCQSKTSGVISCDKIFVNTIYNELLGIGIPEVLINVISCHGLTKGKKINFHISNNF